MRGLLIISLLAVGIAGVRAAETIDRVLALVAGNLITLTDVTAARDLGLVSAEAAADPVRAVLSKLIDRELILAEADRYAPPEPDAEAVDREVQRVRARFQSPQAFDLALARSGIDEKHLRETLREDLRISAYLDQRFTVPAGSGSPGSPGNDDRRQALVGEWLAGLRRRADIIDFYLPGR
jgi:SurA N-terminal domain